MAAPRKEKTPERERLRQKSNDKLKRFSARTAAGQSEAGPGNWAGSRRWIRNFRCIYTGITAKADENAQFLKFLRERKARAQQSP